MLSVIIPCYREPFVNETIKTLVGDMEIIVVVDGYHPEAPIIDDKRVKTIIHAKNWGMRAAINTGLENAHGDMIMKVDGHCVFGEGFDKLTFPENWLMIPRKYSLDFINWKRDESRPYVDYHYLNYPEEIFNYGWYMGPRAWFKRNKTEIDDTMAFQGSCWIANRKYFMAHVGSLDGRKKTYGTFAQEQQEIGLKYWLGGGEVKVNKNIWYAHLSKRKHHYKQRLFSRTYKREYLVADGNTYACKHWINNEEPNMIHPFSWLIEKFWPVPTWPEDRSLWTFQQ